MSKLTAATLRFRQIVAVGMAMAFVASTPRDAPAETISGALSGAYRRSPAIGAARAALRAADEGVSQANAGFRPRVTTDAFIGRGYQRGLEIDGPVHGSSIPGAGGLRLSQNLFDGNRTVNGVRQAEAGVLASREDVRLVEQQVLRDAAAAYMNVLRDTAVVELEANNIAALREQLRHTRDLNRGGYVTPTDVAQAAAALTLARSDYAVASATLQSTMAEYRRVVGVPPQRLEAARSVDYLLPSSLELSIRVATVEAPSVVAAIHQFDAALLQVRLEEGRLYPTVDAFANVQAARDSQGFLGDQISRGDHVVTAGTALRAEIPVYAGGATEAAVRRAKDVAAQARLRVESERRLAQARLERAWGRLRAAHQLVTSSRAAIDAAQMALSNVRLEAGAGKRTTLDVLRAQAALLVSRVALVRAQRDTVAFGYEALAELGWLSPARLGLDDASSDPRVHFDQVKDRWSGLRTPDGR